MVRQVHHPTPYLQLFQDQVTWILITFQFKVWSDKRRLQIFLWMRRDATKDLRTCLSPSPWNPNSVMEKNWICLSQPLIGDRDFKEMVKDMLRQYVEETEPCVYPSLFCRSLVILYLNSLIVLCYISSLAT